MDKQLFYSLKEIKLPKLIKQKIPVCSERDL